MVCHMFYAQEKEGVKKLKKHWENGEGIEWIRIYSLPEFIYYSHKRHLDFGLQCRDCHGPVEEMEVLTKYSSLEMGWCLDCHKVMKASIDCLICHK
jgi:hypothetical protein